MSSGSTFTPAAAPAAPPAAVAWPSVYDHVLVVDGDGREATALVTSVAERDGQPAVVVRPYVGLRMPTSDGGLLRYSASGERFTWRWPSA